MSNSSARNSTWMMENLITEFSNTLKGQSVPSYIAAANGMHALGYIYGSEIERWFLIIYLISTLLIILVLNGAFIIVASAFEKFHSIHFMVLIGYALCDIVFNTVGVILMILSWFFGAEQSNVFCRYGSAVAIGGFFNIIYHCGLVAFERFMYFIHPLHYSMIFTKRNTLFIMAGMYVLTYGYTVLTEIFIWRKFVPVSLMCMLEDAALQSTLQIVVFFVPSLGISTYSIIRTWLLANKLRIAPAGSSDEAKKASVRHAVRLVLLVSGGFWGTYFPVFVARSIIHRNFTWDQLNYRYNTAISITYRILILIMSSISSVLNPIIYFYTHHSLLRGLKVLLGFAESIDSEEQIQQNSMATTA